MEPNENLKEDGRKGERLAKRSEQRRRRKKQETEKLSFRNPSGNPKNR
jgi:hypothetical protein